MPYRLPSDIPNEDLPPLRWRRGLTVDADTEYRKKLLKLGAEEVSREDAAEVIEDGRATDQDDASAKPKAAKPKK